MHEESGVLIDIGHPAHVHVFRHVISRLIDEGRSVYVTARRKEVSLDLLKAFGIQYREIGTHKRGLWSKGSHAVARTLELSSYMRRNRIGVALGVHNPYVATGGWIARTPTAVLVDSEPVRYDRLMTFPFATYLLTPRGLRLDLGAKQQRFDGFKELAYLHPRYFRPDPKVLSMLGVSSDERYFLVRFVAWQAEHDVGQSGLNPSQRFRLVRSLEKHGRVFVSSENPLSDDLVQYRLPLPPEFIHHALAFASLLFSESQTMTTEAAILGTPVVQCNTLVGTMSNFSELQERYGLIQATRDVARAVDLAESTASNPATKREARARALRLIAEKIDVAEYLAGVASAILDHRLLPSGGIKSQQV